jgi:acyl carrier protein
MTDAVLRRVEAIVRAVAGERRIPADANPDTPLGDDGYWLDSVEVLEVILACEQEFATRLDQEPDLGANAFKSAPFPVRPDSSDGRVTETRGAQLPPARGFDAIWRARPDFFSRRAWFVMLALDCLPWPLGERLLAGIFVAKAS